MKHKVIRLSALPEGGGYLIAREDTPEIDLNRTRLAQAFEKVLKSLDPHCRRAVELVYGLNGTLPVKKRRAAKIMGVSPPTLYSYLGRAKIQFLKLKPFMQN